MPGAPAGALFAAFSEPRLNNLGQVAFSATLAADDDTIDRDSDFGVWALDLNGNIVPVLLEGTDLEVSPGDTRIVDTMTISDFSDAGSLALHVTFKDGSDAIIRAQLPVPALQDFDGWNDQIINPEAAGKTDDADGDGLLNIVEFALGLNPNAADEVEPPIVGLLNVAGSEGEVAVLTLTFNRRLDQNEVTYVVEVSSDLITWMSGAEFIGIVNARLIGDNLEEVIVRELLPTGQFERCFVRLRIAYDP